MFLIRIRIARSTRITLSSRPSRTKRASARHILKKIGGSIFQDIIKAEKTDGRRIIAENDSAIAFLPYFARYAYEVFVAPKETHPSIAAMSANEIGDLADVLKTVLVKFDNLWRMPFPYVMPLASGTDRRRRLRCISFSHRVSSAAAKTESAQISRRARDRRRQFFERHFA